METYSRKELKETISQIIAEILENEDQEILENAHLIDDVGLDSMGFLELAIRIQRIYNITIPNEQWAEMKQLKNILDSVESKILEG